MCSSSSSPPCASPLCLRSPASAESRTRSPSRWRVSSPMTGPVSADTPSGVPGLRKPRRSGALPRGGRLRRRARRLRRASGRCLGGGSGRARGGAGRVATRGPIVVEGRLWGALLVHSTQPEPLPADTESRLLNFSELVGTAISNAQARAEVHRLAEEQAALRRVATLVARESPPAEVFTKVAEEVGLLLGAESAWMHFYEPDGSGTVVGTWGELGTASRLARG